MQKPVNPLSLRLSGHLLVGLTRIYAKKVQYLYIDVSEAYNRLNSFSRTSSTEQAEKDPRESAANLNIADTSIRLDVL